MRPIHERMEVDLKLGGYSPGTRKIYLLYARLFAKYFNRPPEEMGENEVRTYLLYLIEQRHASRGTIRQVRAALSFLYAVTLHRPVEHSYAWLRASPPAPPCPVTHLDLPTWTTHEQAAIPAATAG